MPVGVSRVIVYRPHINSGFGYCKFHPHHSSCASLISFKFSHLWANRILGSGPINGIPSAPLM